MVDRVAPVIHRIAQDGAELAWKGVGDDSLALDQAGIAVAGFFFCRPPVDQNDLAPTLCRCSATLTPTIPAPRTITSAREPILLDPTREIPDQSGRIQYSERAEYASAIR